MWVRFTAPFVARLTTRCHVHYEPGMTANVVRRCAEQAIAEGKAEPTERANVGSRKLDGAGRVRAAHAGKPRRAE